ncbi:hypothetical protein [Micromonospora sp. ATA51]|uniref:hypothetical protein n=1 Tax=Micromonospora sp. ATA51 TaxID=2806098 RepID=UPI001EE499EF|nr:hypothetical protein [Micromonospora sp. ATA51]
MSGRQKLLLAALAVLLVALYLVAVAGGRRPRRPGRPAGLAGPPERAEPHGGPGHGHRRLPGRPRPAVARRRRAEGGELRRRLRAAHRRPRRPAHPGAAQPGAVRGGRPGAGDAEVTVRDEVEPAADGEAVAKVAVDRATAVTLRCPGGAGCAVTVAPS